MLEIIFMGGGGLQLEEQMFRKPDIVFICGGGRSRIGDSLFVRERRKG